MAKYFYLQQEGGEDVWQEALANSRQDIIASKRPRYTTVLDLSELISEGMTREQLSKVAYFGPLYFDWDHPDNEFVIGKVQQFAAQLEERGVNLASIRWYATGGRGFHAELPQGLFMPKVPAKGTPLLPQIYREMAYELFTDAMDMRVYSARRGRMWRTPNVQRENGRYKVPLTPTELLSMTEAEYAVVTSAPREAPEIVPAEFNNDLGLIFAKAEQKVDAASKRAGNSAKNAELLSKFKGEWPPTVKKLMAGTGIAPGTGFHPIAMQLAITANALGKSEDQLLAECEGLIADHVSDGHRYNTPAKRRAELSRMYHYTQGNVCYTYAKDAVKKLAAPNVDTSDLDGMTADAGASLMAVPEGESVEDYVNELAGGLDMRERGIYKKTQEDGAQMICDLSFKDVGVLLSMPERDKPAEVWGYEADVNLRGRSRGHQQIDMQVFLSKSKFQEFAMKNMGVMKGGDNDVASLSTILRDAAEANGKVSYVTRREGLDLVQRPGAKEEKIDAIWSQGDGVFGGPPNLYTYRPMIPSGSLFKTDLWHAQPMSNATGEREFIEALFRVNEPFVIATLLGWMTSAFHRSFYHREFNAFPLLTVFGQAGSGKTQTSLLLSQMHYHMERPVNHQTISLTPYVLETRVASSSSIPFLLDEYKPREFPVDFRKRVQAVLRGAHDNGASGRGGDKDQIGQSYKSIGTTTLCSPVMYIGEALETQTALMERTIAVPVSKAGLAGRKNDFKLVCANRRLLGRLGRSILDASFGIEFAALAEKLERNREQAETVFREGQERPVFNMAVTLTGFDFMTQVLRAIFGNDMDTTLASLRESILDDTKLVSGAIMAEASKVLDVLALMSKTEDQFSGIGLRADRDYAFTTVGRNVYVDLRLDTAYIQYAKWCQDKAQERMYDNFAAFCEGLAHYSPMVNRHCPDSPLREGSNTKVYRFSIDKLADEGVQGFKNSPV